MRELRNDELELVCGGYDPNEEIVVVGTPYPSPYFPPYYNPYAPSPYYPGGGGGGGSPTPAPAPTTYTTPGGHSFQVGANLSQAQAEVLGKIVDYGFAHGYTLDDIYIAAKNAFNESSFNNSAVNSGHYGLYQYDTTTWQQRHSDIAASPQTATVDQMIRAMYDDISHWHTRYSAGYNSTWNYQTMGDNPSVIPADIDFQEYVQAKHHGGSDTWQFHSTTVQTYINGYNTTAAQLALWNVK